jgi:K+-transporting ATPase ATPase C chain
MFTQLIPALRTTLFFTALTGFIYPVIVTGLSQLFFNDQANGSLVSRKGRIVGSSLIGQNFTRSEYFHSRPSSAGNGYDASISSGSNLGPTSQRLIDRIRASEAQFRSDNPDFDGSLPADSLTASASGLDPHISPAAAHAQVGRIAKSRAVTPAQIQQLVDRFTESRTIGIFGEPRVNVLMLNIALDEQVPVSQ